MLNKSTIEMYNQLARDNAALAFMHLEEIAIRYHEPRILALRKRKALEYWKTAMLLLATKG